MEYGNAWKIHMESWKGLCAYVGIKAMPLLLTVLNAAEKWRAEKRKSKNIVLFRRG